MNKCNNCNTETSLFFCPNCGRIFEYPDFIKGDQRQEKSLATFITAFVQEAKEKKVKVSELVDKSVLSEAVYRQYFERILYLQELCKNSTIYNFFDANGESLYETMTDFGRQCLVNECQIAIAGTIKSGKSMFLNAILGKEIASTYPTPETAALTKFRYSPDDDYVKVTYYSSDEWDLLWKSVMESSANSYRDDKEDFLSEYNRLNADSIKSTLLNRKNDIFEPRTYEELKQLVTKYTSAKHAEHFFAKEVEVGLHSFKVPKNIVFVDTPGLNDPVSFRSAITRKYMHSANVVLLCVKAATAEISGSELEDIARLFSILRYSKERIYLFGTQIDLQIHFTDYWQNLTKPEFKKYLAGKSFFGSEEVSEERILPVTAWYYNLTQRIKNDSSKWDDIKTVDEIDNMLRRCLGRPVVQQFNKKHVYDDDDTAGLKDCFYSSVRDLEEKTYVPMISKIIMEGPIKNAERIIKQDYQHTCRIILHNLSEVAADTLSTKRKTIQLINRSDLQKIISKLEMEINEKEQQLPRYVEAIDILLKSLSQTTNKIINDLKNK